MEKDLSDVVSVLERIEKELNSTGYYSAASQIINALHQIESRLGDVEHAVKVVEISVDSVERSVNALVK